MLDGGPEPTSALAALHAFEPGLSLRFVCGAVGHRTGLEVGE